MGDLFWNKIAAVFLATLLVVMGLREISSIVFSVDAPEEIIYPVDLSALETSGGEEEEEPVDIGLLLASADPSAGEQVARRCAACHTFDEGGGNGTGPALHGVMGREVASVDGFGYSSAMEEYADGGTEWLYENMFEYLAGPRQYVPGTSMAFAGLRGEEDRANLIAYMAEQSPGAPDFPEPLPEEEEAEQSEDGEGADVAEADGSTDVSEEEAEDASGEDGADEAAEDEEGLEAESEEAVEEAESEDGEAEGGENEDDQPGEGDDDGGDSEADETDEG